MIIQYLINIFVKFHRNWCSGFGVNGAVSNFLPNLNFLFVLAQKIYRKVNWESWVTTPERKCGVASVVYYNIPHWIWRVQEYLNHEHCRYCHILRTYCCMENLHPIVPIITYACHIFGLINMATDANYWNEYLINKRI